MVQINWKRNNKYGLDYSTMEGICHDYRFDIRYDYDGDENIEPNCILYLRVYFKGKPMTSYPGLSIESLVIRAQKHLENDIMDFYKKYGPRAAVQI